jgi:integrase/recombinase XerD
MRTVAQVASEMLGDRNLSQRTKQIYTGILLPYLDGSGRLLVSEVRRPDVERFLESRCHLGFRSFNLVYSVLNRLFSFAAEIGEIEVSPMAHIKRRRPDRSKGESRTEGVEYLKPGVLSLLFKRSESNPRLFALLHLLHDTGARIAEVLGLDVDDVDLRSREIRVIGKGNKTRICYFGLQAEAALRQYLNGGREGSCEAIFTERMKRTMAVRRLSYASAHRDLRRVTSDSVKLGAVTFHQLRHTFATERAQIVPIETLRVLLGHENIQTTMIYQKITSDAAGGAARLALAKLGNL